MRSRPHWTSFLIRHYGWFLYHYVTNKSLKSQRAIPFSQRKRKFCYFATGIRRFQISIFLRFVLTCSVDFLACSCRKLLWVGWSILWLCWNILWRCWNILWLKKFFDFAEIFSSVSNRSCVVTRLDQSVISMWTKNNLMTLHVGKSRIRIKWQFQPPPLSIWHRVWPRESR